MQNELYLCEELAKTIFFGALIILFYYRSEKIMKYKARMLMSTYDVCMSMNNNQSEETEDELDKTTTINI